MVKLDSPFPKPVASREQLQQYPWQVIKELKLERPGHLRNEFFLDVLEKRKTRREFSYLNKDTLGEVFYLSNRTISRDMGVAGLIEEHRPVISSGGLHCVECLVMFPNDKSWYRYDSMKNSLESVSLSNTDFLIRECRDFFPTASKAAIIWYLGDVQRISGKYVNPESLIWRDVGAVIATHSLVCEYLKLAYCPLGITGQSYAPKISNKRELMGLGMALIGNYG